MLIVDGPNIKLAEQVYEMLKERLGSDATFYGDGMLEQPTIRNIVKVLHTDNRADVRRGFLTYKHYTPGERHMIASGLAAAGTVCVVCLNVTQPQVVMNDFVCYDELIPMHIVLQGRLNASVIQSILAMWHERRISANETWEYCSTGNSSRQPIMLVVDNAPPYVPLSEARRLAMVSHHGSSRFLHDILDKAGGRYYITYSVKENDDKEDRKLLQEEILKVKPSRVISMGDVAAKHLSELTAFVRTYHPQYSSRFQRNQVDTLITLLKP